MFATINCNKFLATSRIIRENVFKLKLSKKMIPQKTVQEIIDTAKIEEVVGDFVNLKRAGANLKGLCPFHNEKTPSFVVSPAKNLCKCFGCGKGGDPVRFMMNHENLSFPDALRYLAGRYNIEIVEKEMSADQKKERQLIESLYIINQYAADFFAKEMFESDEGKSIGMSYFKERGFREEIIQKFTLGYSPRKKDAFTLQATMDSHSLEFLKKLGLTTQYGSDFFRERVIFPIRNLSGKIIGFGGRILKKGAKAAKYINSPETDIYTKSKVLYGAFFAKTQIRKLDECILVEGYTDVLSLHQAGIENVVASSGTSLTIDQIKLVSRFTKNIKILYDGDNAGIKAALRGLDLVLEQDLNVRVVLLPDGEDPDSYLQKVGTEAFQKYLEENADDFIFFKTKLLLEEAQNDPIKKTRLISNIIETIAKIPNALKRSLYIKECAGLMDVDESLLVNEANKVIKSLVKKSQYKKREFKPRDADGNFPPPSAMDVVPEDEMDASELSERQLKNKQSAQGDEFQEKDIARILITSGDQIFDEEENLTVAAFLLSNVQDVLEHFDSELYRRIVRDCMEKVVANEPLPMTYFINHSDEEIAKFALDVSADPWDFSENWEARWEIKLRSQLAPEDNFSLDSIQALQRFKLKKVIKMCSKNQEEMKAAAAEQDNEKVMMFMKMQMKLNEMRNELAKELKTVVLK